MFERLSEFCRHPDHGPPWYVSWDPGYNDEIFGVYAKPCVDALSLPRVDSPYMTSNTTLLLFRLQHTTPVTRALLQEQLTAKANVLGKLLCPHVTVQDGQLLLPFSPGSCACFDSPRWVGHSCDGSILCCHSNAAKMLGLAGYFLPVGSNGSHNYRCEICWATYTWERDG